MLLTEVFGPTQLYHYMDVAKAADVFRSDCMPARWTHTIPGLGERAGNSFSRRKEFHWHQNYIVKLTVDARSLANSNRIIPLDGEAVFSQSIGGPVLRDRMFNRPRGGNTLAEEFVLGDIKRISRTIQSIQIGHYSVQYATIQMVELAQAYADRFDIPLTIDSRMAAAIEQTKARWEDDDD